MYGVLREKGVMIFDEITRVHISLLRKEKLNLALHAMLARHVTCNLAQDDDKLVKPFCLTDQIRRAYAYNPRRRCHSQCAGMPHVRKMQASVNQWFAFLPRAQQSVQRM